MALNAAQGGTADSTFSSLIRCRSYPMSSALLEMGAIRDASVGHVHLAVQGGGGVVGPTAGWCTAMDLVGPLRGGWRDLRFIVPLATGGPPCRLVATGPRLKTLWATGGCVDRDAGGGRHAGLS